MNVDNNNCGICMDAMSHCDGKAGSDTSKLHCGHAFHKECIAEWVKPVLTKDMSADQRPCPFCRESLNSKDLFGLKKFKGKVTAVTQLALWMTGAAVFSAVAGACVVGAVTMVSDKPIGDKKAEEELKQMYFGLGTCGMLGVAGASACMGHAYEAYQDLRHSVERDSSK